VTSRACAHSRLRQSVADERADHEVQDGGMSRDLAAAARGPRGIEDHVPAAVARIGGAFIFEIPTIWNQMKVSKNCNDFSKGIGKMFAIAFDYYI
jgi:hypothetical protein